MKLAIIRDSTLREGIELPGMNISLEERVKIAQFLENMNVPEIEIGMPYGLKDCLPLAKLIKEKKLRIKTSALILSYRSTWKEEVSLAAESGIGRIEILIPTSDILLNLREYYKIRKEDLLGLLGKSITYAKRYFKNVGIGFVDATRTSRDLLIHLTQNVGRAGADRIIIYDTIGIATPFMFKEMVSGIRQKSSLQIIAHCHNDFGLATANSLAGIQAGADGADVVVNGLGDRGGNAAFEEVVLALKVLYGIETGIRLEKINELSSLVEKITGMRKPKVKPIVGDFTFLHSPVMHIRNAASGNYRGFEPFAPELIGSERKYAFALPVDYSEALSPFYKKLQLNPNDDQEASIINALRSKSNTSGLSEKQILEIIEKTLSRKSKK